jgi:hypothetical protein
MGHKKRILVVLLLVVLALGVGCGVYVSDYYPADQAALTAMASSSTVTVQQQDGVTVFLPENPQAGFVFYPGGKVDADAYAPLLQDLAQEGILCVLVEMPFRLAVLDVNAADGLPQQYPDIDRWYIGGHSLGGSMAASYAAKHSDTYQGLILLAAYSTADLRDTGLEVLSLRGTEDGVLNEEKYQQYFSNLPSDTQEILIQGGNHANFGSYGSQDGDGTATVSPQEQQAVTAQAIADLVLS